MIILYSFISIAAIAAPFEAIDYLEFSRLIPPKRWWWPAAFAAEVPIVLLLWWAGLGLMQ